MNIGQLADLRRNAWLHSAHLGQVGFCLFSGEFFAYEPGPPRWQASGAFGFGRASEAGSGVSASDPSVDRQRRAGDGTGGVACQEKDNIGEFLRRDPLGGIGLRHAG